MSVADLSRQLEEAMRSPTESGRQEAIVHVLALAIREVATLQGRVNDLEQRLDTISDKPAAVGSSGPALRG
jgi:hypothetical protein